MSGVEVEGDEQASFQEDRAELLRLLTPPSKTERRRAHFQKLVARTEADPVARAELVAEADAVLAELEEGQ